MSNIIKVIGNVGVGSGYRQATTNIFDCFLKSNLKCNFQDKKGNKINYKNFGGESNISFYITAPPFGKLNSNYKIAYFYWEADSFPKAWIDEIHHMEEVWSPCQLTYNCLKKMNYKGKIRIVPTPSRPYRSVKNLINFEVEDNLVIDDSCFKFYSIFQWNYRKGYDLLIKSYLEEFSENENVLLILKVNPIFKNGDFRGDVINFINKIKSKINKNRFPKILILDYFLKNKEIDALHETSDCFILPHRGEGWGMPIARAIQYDNFIITTKFGGVCEYLNDNNANIIKHKLEPVSGMGWSNLYNSSQNWAAPDQDSIKEKMRYVFEKRDYSTILNRVDLKQYLSMENFIANIENYL